MYGHPILCSQRRVSTSWPPVNPQTTWKQPDLVNLPKPIEQLRIVFHPDPVLRKRCEKIERFDEQLAALAQRMQFLLNEADGVGLAAPQVGVPIRMFICSPTDEPEDNAVWVNPVLSDLQGAVETDEGCLSIPGVSVLMRRAPNVVIQGYDIDGHPKQADASELLARVWQHECDHLDGRLIIDSMSASAELANRRTIQQLEADYAAAVKR